MKTTKYFKKKSKQTKKLKKCWSVEREKNRVVDNDII